ncbi:bifunctional 3-deoxy-7-phosphoheptulonate synthase/chorismate mutase type II [Plebeiibacterium sediminum]|uniref:chorismate mutase n=1 Tax=Plebeiibacterium sediminum TaxID=2992112 RepID=A0AAE3SFN4_9BACT|nr:bifunctional 3-deoxy-7-phosphoheptulonate synthase/chorismate mutase type II [Plebeiobacterium sediminum]MCW3787277.1 bifunctional 3-deoxy-7-phosphoheptulonate synthase/chorismate mutase type II [Plebeiobacterium sediminum]
MVKLDLEKINLPGLELERPWMIAGPCSAETEEQVFETAQQVKEAGFKIFRAGIWKPRTRPGAFEGVGTIGLPWLKRVKEELGLFVGTEVANAHHVFEAIKHGIDILWVGARTTANPFAVQEIADALKGTEIPVLVKNPVNPDLELWIGALERINQAGIKKLAAIHRGFSTYDKTKYRNHPQWQIPIELRRRIPDLPIICDPSHISGKRELIYEISQEAMDLNFDGLLVEAHRCPEKAWSDASQQVTPEELKAISEKIVLRAPKIGEKPRVTLDELRQQIDTLDTEVLETLKKRMEIAEAIGRYKKENNITILQTRRYDEIMNNRKAKGAKMGLSDEFLTKLFESIHQESVTRQNKIMNS